MITIRKKAGYISALACACILFSTAGAISAQGGELQPSSPLTLRGYGTLGIARSTNSQGEVARDLSQPRGIGDHWSAKIDSDFGLQLNYVASNTLEAVVQAVSRYNDRGNFSPELTELLLKYDPNPYLSLRAGRVSTDFLMHGDSRLIGYSQLTARPNIDYYSTLAVTYLDGLDAQLTFPLAGGLLSAKGYFGFLGEKLPFIEEGALDLRGSRAFGAYLDYQSGGWQWRGGLAQIRFKNSMPYPVQQLQGMLRASGVPTAQQAADDLELQGSKARYYTLGVVYDRGPLMVQLMLGRTRYDSIAIQDQDSGMFLAGYRIEEFKPFVGYSKTRSRASHVSSGLPNVGYAALMNAGLSAVQAASHTDQHTYTVGLRWDFRQDMALKFQVDAIRGKPDSVATVRRETPRWDGKTNVFTITLDFVF